MTDYCNAVDPRFPGYHTCHGDLGHSGEHYRPGVTSEGADIWADSQSQAIQGRAKYMACLDLQVKKFEKILQGRSIKVAREGFRWVRFYLNHVKTMDSEFVRLSLPECDRCGNKRMSNKIRDIDKMTMLCDSCMGDIRREDLPMPTRPRKT